MKQRWEAVFISTKNKKNLEMALVLLENRKSVFKPLSLVQTECIFSKGIITKFGILAWRASCLLWRIRQ